MKGARETDRLIRSLVAEAGQAGGWVKPSVRRALAVAVMPALVLAVAASLALFADPALFGEPTARRWMGHKIVCMAACGAGAWAILEDLARPGRATPRFVALLPAAALLCCGAIFDRSDATLLGRSATSVPICAGAIVLLSLPALVLIMRGLRDASATTRPTAAGAASGLLAGSLGAGAYALACRNNGGLFILVWYGAALAVVAALGAVAGRRILSW